MKWTSLRGNQGDMQLWATEAGEVRDHIDSLTHLSFSLSTLTSLRRRAVCEKSRGRKESKNIPRRENVKSNFHHNTHKLGKGRKKNYSFHKTTKRRRSTKWIKLSEITQKREEKNSINWYQKMTSNMGSIQWRVPSLGALLLVLVFMPHLFSKVPYVNAAWVLNFRS